VVLSALGASILTLLVVAFLSWDILRRKVESTQIQDLTKKIRKGAGTFLRNEYSIVAVVVVVVAVLLGIAPQLMGVSGEDAEIGVGTAIAFVIGAIASGLAGFVAMSVATRSNGRTTEAAMSGLKKAFQVSYSSGAVTGLAISAIALLGLILCYFLFDGRPADVNGYAMGASLIALFARSGGGIFTKGADMGADLVGKVEAGIPEDDPRNPAVIADNVGDNVGDIAGLGSDLLESFVEAIISAMAIAYTLSFIPANEHWSDALVLLPFGIIAWGMVSSLIGVLWTRFGPVRSAQASLNIGVVIATVIMLIGAFVIVQNMGVNFSDEDGVQYRVLGPFWALTAGLVAGLVIAGVSLYFTDANYNPVKRLAGSARSGTAVLIVGGLNLGMISTWVPVLAVAAASLIGYLAAGIYGIGLGALGMLSTLGITLAVDSYGPVADNAGGLAEMTGQDPEVRHITDSLDSVGNTTAAIGKGFAIGSAAFAALALITAYMHTVNRFADQEVILSLADPELVAGLLIGGMIPFLFSALLGNAVGRIAGEVVEEVRRQFKEITGLMEGKAEPDTESCVGIAARGALRSIALPGLLAVLIPVILGFTLGPVALAGLIMGGLIAGLPLAIMMANSGGAWDNAKKYVEEGRFGGKGTDTHKATVTGDTIGDPLKDTMGPSIDILIKLMSITALVLAPAVGSLV
jgi:K(+)-stimulated pyrophosphate-energized sodium pump